MKKPPSDRTTVKRKPQRAAYDRATVDKILDEAPICHVGFSVDGQTFVLPMIHVRVGDKVYLHGSPASRTLQALARGVARSEILGSSPAFNRPSTPSATPDPGLGPLRQAIDP